MRSWYLDEVGVEPSHEDPLDELLLFAVLVTNGRGHGTVRRGRHQEGFVEVLRELLDKAYSEETAPGMRFTLSIAPRNETTSAGQRQLGLSAATALSWLWPPQPQPEPAPAPAATRPVCPVPAPHSSALPGEGGEERGRDSPLMKRRLGPYR